MMEKVINTCYASNILLSCPPPLLKRACPTADARQNAKRAGSHAGGEGITCPPSFWRKGWCTLFYYIPCLWTYTLVLRNISQ
jgi:hypothetical protein